MRLLVLGDIVGRAGRKAVLERLPGLVAAWRLDGVVINGENAAGGFGITAEICQDVLDAGADVVTLGNHAFDQKEALVHIEREPRLIRPANFPPGTPGRGATVVDLRGGARLLVVNVMGRVHMAPLDDPFVALDRELEQAPLGRVADAVVVDVHCEATSEKQAVGLHCDGRASVVVGTHTHVPTADHRILPGGTAFVTDIGMCGDYVSVIGMKSAEPLHRFRHALPSGRFEPADGEATLSGIAVDLDASTGLARSVFPVRIGGSLSEARPDW
jgi:metallophosphoesterase (TIGR00282 family)